MTNIITQNSKLKPLGVHGFGRKPRLSCVKCVYGRTMPARRRKDEEAPTCYCCKAFYAMGSSNDKWSATERLIRRGKWAFVNRMVEEIVDNDIETLRIHTEGDFKRRTVAASQNYLDWWTLLANTCYTVRFYCYTKSHNLDWRAFDKLPNTARIQSLGGEYDHLIDKTGIIADWFSDKENMAMHGYTDGTKNDLICFDGIKRIGLLKH